LSGNETNNFCPLQGDDSTGTVKIFWTISVKTMQAPIIPRRTAIIVDATDSLPPTAKDMLSAQFKLQYTSGLNGQQWQSNLHNYEKVSIYELKESVVALGKPSFEMCAPIHNAVNVWTDNQRKRVQVFRNKFTSKIEEYIAKLVVQPERDRSPIMETISQIAKNNDRIFIVSDMMEHASGSCSLYSTTRHDYDKLAGRDCAGFSAASLAGKDIHVLLVLRNKLRYQQNPALVEFWETHFSKRGAKVSFEVLGDIPTSCKGSPDPVGCSVCLAPGFIENHQYCPDAAG
ncbi:MAG: hypothetical protein ACR2P9_09510, partial [Gammaproteobacteria bacterium]